MTALGRFISGQLLNLYASREENCISRTAIIRNPHFPYIEIKEGAEKTYAVRKHSHEELSFGFVEKGSSRIFCRSLHFDMDVNQSLLLPPGTIHLCEPSEAEQFRFRMLYIDPHWFRDVFHIDPKNLKPETARLAPCDIRVKERFFLFFSTLDDPMSAESEAVLFIGALVFNVFCITKWENASDEVENAISSIKEYLDAEFTEQIQLNDLSAIAGMDKFTLLRKFNAVFRLTPHAYILNKRINHARQLLLSGESVAQTAALCGFFDQSHFVKTFRLFYGMNPADYKSKKQ